MYTYILFEQNGEETRVNRDNKLTLKEMQELIGGRIEYALCPFSNDYVFVVREDGRNDVSLKQNQTHPSFVGPVLYVDKRLVNAFPVRINGHKVATGRQNLYRDSDTEDDDEDL